MHCPDRAPSTAQALPPMTAAFDTHAAVKTLREAGADEAMAEAIVNTASAAAGVDRDDLATKADIADLKADMLKVAIGVVIANATLTAVLVFGALRLLQP